MQIRPETPADFAAVANINIQAFKRSEEAVVVALMRQRLAYTPKFSLVAEENGKILGHILFTPSIIRFDNADRRVVLLAPIAVHPEAQKKGVGAALIQEGHRIAQAEGFEASFLIGHDTYYPRFGYQTHAYGGSSLNVKVADLAPSTLESRAPAVADIPALLALWEHEEGAIDFTIRHEAHLVDWLSPNPTMKALAYWQDGEIVGYLRGKAEDIRLFLAKNYEVAQMMAKDIAGEAEAITLPLHPLSYSATAFAGVPQFQSWSAAMIYPFTWDYQPSAIAGRVLWLSAFDVV